MLSDPIADMLTRIRNASAVFKKEVFVPFSREKEEIAKILANERYISGLKIMPAKKSGMLGKTAKVQNKNLVLELKYDGNKPVILGIERVSRPGLRTYLSCKKLPIVFSGFGNVIISTSKGIMTGRQARKKRLGGEVICKVW